MSPTVVEIPLEDGAVLLRPGSGDLVRLNATALDLWREVRAGVPDSEVIAGLAAREGRDADDIRSAVAGSLEELRRFGATESGSASRDAPSPRRVSSERIDAKAWTCTVGPFRALDHRFAVRADDPQVAKLAAELFAPLLDLDHPGSRPVTTYSVRSRRHRWLPVSLWRDRQPIAFAPDHAGAVARLAWFVNTAAAATGAGLAFHAAAAGDSDRVVLLAGVSGAGKSTLVAGLAAAGFGYLGDEIAVVDKHLVVTGVPRGPVLSEASLRALALDPSRVTWLDGEAHVSPEQLRAGSVQAAGRLAAVATIRFRAGQQTTERRVSGSDAVTGLLPHIFAASELTQPHAAILGTVISRVPVRHLETGNLDDAVASVRRWLTGGSSGSV